MNQRNKALLAMLAAMTLLTFGGPVGVGLLLRGGASPDWPPDRAVEWLAVLGSSACVLGLMLAILILGARARHSGSPSPRAEGPA